MIAKWLDESRFRKELLFLHLDETDTHYFTAGFVQWHRDDWVFASAVDRVGRPDGFLLVRVARVARLSRGGVYYENLAQAARQHESSVPEFHSCDPDGVLAYVGRNRRAVWLHDRHEGVTKGFVRSHDEGTIEVDTYTSALHFDGCELIRMDDIDRIEFGGTNQQLLENLILQPSHEE